MAQFNVGDKVKMLGRRIRPGVLRRELNGVITKFGPNNIFVRADGTNEVWRCHPFLLVKAIG